MVANTLPERPRFQDERWGLITLPNDQGWTFQSPHCHPPSELGKIPTIMAVEFAIIFNRSEWARQLRQWAVVTGNGGLLRLKNVSSSDRPTDPADFPPGTRIVVGRAAEESAAEENQERHRLSKIPREWTVPIRPLIVRLKPDPEPQTITVLECPIPIQQEDGPTGWLVGRVGKADWVAKSREEIGPLQGVLKMRAEKEAASS